MKVSSAIQYFQLNTNFKNIFYAIKTIYNPQAKNIF